MIHLGFEVGTGQAVEIPLAHTFVTGQTQLSGKTTALRAIVERSGQRALAFVTKRGESFDGRRIPPYLPREGDRPIHWRLVETLLASALGQRNMKWERFQIINAAKGARSLADVRANVARLHAKAGKAAEIYFLLGEYLDLILPEMRQLGAADVLNLQPGLNVMDLAGAGAQLQALVIRAALEHINLHERGVLTVFPEAWEFAPRSRSAPAKDEAIAMARKGAVLGNYLLCDSQDLAGVDTVIRQASSVWLLGVQRELNELKRTLQMIPAGIKRPRSEDVATLELGQFYVCWGTHATKTYVQPVWLDDGEAKRCALTGDSPRDVAPHLRSPATYVDDATGRAHRYDEEETVTPSEALELRSENTRLKADNERLSAQVERLLGRVETLEKGAAHDPETTVHPRHATPARQPGPDVAEDAAPAVRRDRPAAASVGTVPPIAFEADEEGRYQAFKTRLIEEATNPVVLRVLMQRPELVVEIESRTITTEGDSYIGRLGRMIVAAFFDEPRRFQEIAREMERTGPRINNISVNKALAQLVLEGFLTKESAEGYRVVAAMKVRIVEKAA